MVNKILKNNIYTFYKPVKLKEYSFFIRKNEYSYQRLIIIVPKYIIKYAYNSIII